MLIALAAMLAAFAPIDPPPQGTWTVASVERAPWAQGQPDRNWVSQSIRFRRGRVVGAQPLGCTAARWAIVVSPANGLFQGGLAEDRAEADAARLGIPLPAVTYRLSCSTGLFDFHRTATGLILALDNDLLRLEPTKPR
jgi:hypothetical protein